CEMSQWLLLGRKSRRQPEVAAAAQLLLAQRRDHASGDDRRLATAGTADDDRKIGLLQPLENFPDLMVAADEQPLFVLLERPQPGIGLARRGALLGCGGGFDRL